MPVWIRKSFYRILLCRPLTRIYDYFWPRQTLGACGELAAERYLLKQGLVVIERGYQDKIGEIDLIAADKKTVVFVEVKTRSSESVNDPVEAVDDTKQMQITRTAKGYLKWHHLENSSVRFDVVAVLWKTGVQNPKVIHYPSAFEATGDYQLF